MATHSSILAWKIPWMEEPGRLQSTESQRVGHDWATSLTGLPWWLSSKEPTCQCRTHRFDSWVRKILWRRKWQPTPVFLPGKSHGQRSLAGYSPQRHKRFRHDLATKQQQVLTLKQRGPVSRSCSVTHPACSSQWSMALITPLPLQLRALFWHFFTILAQLHGNDLILQGLNTCDSML